MARYTVEHVISTYEAGNMDGEVEQTCDFIETLISAHQDRCIDVERLEDRIATLTAENAALKEQYDDMEKAYYDEAKKNMALEAQLAAAEPVGQIESGVTAFGLMRGVKWFDDIPPAKSLIYTTPPQHAAVEKQIAEIIHYPEHWDTAAYPTLGAAMVEVAGFTGCSTCAEQHAARVPEGWQLVSADFSMHCVSPLADGRVTLIRDAAGRQWWHSLDDAGRDREALYCYGSGISFDAAMKEAISLANSLAAPTPSVQEGRIVDRTEIIERMKAGAVLRVEHGPSPRNCTLIGRGPVPWESVCKIAPESLRKIAYNENCGWPYSEFVLADSEPPAQEVE